MGTTRVSLKPALASSAAYSASVRSCPPVQGSTHAFKYRLAYLVNGTCVVRYDNQSGKGDHRHFNTRERPYTFETPKKLRADFQADMAR